MTSKSPKSRSKQVTVSTRVRDTAVTPREHYLREKARRASQAHPDRELMEAAKREYQALLEEGIAKGKGGRPKKKPARPAADTDNEPEDFDADPA